MFLNYHSSELTQVFAPFQISERKSGPGNLGQVIFLVHWVLNRWCSINKAPAPLVEKGKFPEKRFIGILGIITKDFIGITKGENMTQSVLDFGCRKRLYFMLRLHFWRARWEFGRFYSDRNAMVKNLFLSFKTVVPKFATSLVLKSSQYMWESFVEIFSPFLLIPFFF